MQQSAEALGKDAAEIQALRVENMVLQVSHVMSGLLYAPLLASKGAAHSTACMSAGTSVYCQLGDYGVKE